MKECKVIYSIKDNKITHINKYVDRSKYFDKETVFMTGGGFCCKYHTIGKDSFYTKEEAKQALRKLLSKQIIELAKKLKEI